MRKAQEELAKQKEVIMAQDKELKVSTSFTRITHNLFIMFVRSQIILHFLKCLAPSQFYCLELFL